VTDPVPSFSGTWRYGEIAVEILATLTHNGQRYTVPMYGGESLYHAMFKVSIAAHLLAWGYNWKQILWEETPSHGPKGCRPEICAQGNDRLCPRSGLSVEVQTQRN